MNQRKNSPAKEVPNLEAFAPRFLDGHARANRQKASGVAAKEMILRVHVVPPMGHKKIDAIKSEDVQHLKSSLHAKSAKTVNNILTVLNVLLKKAVEWEVLERMPCTIKLLPVPKASTSFYDFDAYERLVAAAKTTDGRAYVLVLLGGEAGLRLGEMVALEWRDIDVVQAAAVRRAIVGERAGRDAEKRAAAVRAADGAARGGVTRRPTSAWATRSLPGRWKARSAGL